jgi:hypothetical protein
VCSNPNKANGTTCTDNNACTSGETCQNGTCGSPTSTVTCTALDQCHVAGTCDTTTGVCSNPNKANGTMCDDGNACTQTDTCQSASCVGSEPVVCTALNQCHTAGTCDPATGMCSNPTRQDGTSCDDGDGCTVGDRCLGGTCTGVPRSCDDGVACTDDSCVAGECRHEPLDGHCDTGECFLAQCTPGTPGADAAGCTRVPVGEGDTCTSDDFACTEDVCTAGACRHTPRDIQCATGEACLPAVCDPTGAGADPAGCVALPERANGAECVEDGDPCTDDSCLAGACRHAPVANKAACDPVRPVYERALALAADARDLSVLATGALGAAATDTSGSPGDMLAASVAEVTSTLERVARILAGKRDAPAETVWALTVAIHPGVTAPSGFPNPALERARASLEQLRHTPAEEQGVIHDLALAQHRALLTPDTARDLRHRGRSLLRGTKGLKRSLQRLKKVSQSFTR